MERMVQASESGEELLRTVFETAPVGLVLLGPDGRVTSANREFCRLLAVPAEEAAGRPLGELLRSPDRPSALDDALAQLRAGQAVTLDLRCQLRGGTTVALALAGTPVRAVEGWTAYCLLQDVTDQRLAEEEYARSASLHRATLESTADGLLVVDDQGRTLTCNQRFLDMWRIPQRIAANGLDAEQLAFVTDQLEDPAGFLSRVRALYADPEASSYDEIRLKDGRIYERYSQPNRIAGRSVGRVWSFRDVTERQRAEEALRESERLLELFFSQSLDGFFFMMLDQPIRWDDATDKDAALDYAFTHERITKVNDAMLGQYGAVADQMIGLTPAALFAHDLEYGRAVLRRSFDARHLHRETNERRLDGTPIVVEGDYICLYTPEGLLQGHFGIQREITERRRAEEALRFSEDKFAKAFRSSPMRVTIGTLAEGRFIEVNDTFLRDHGFTREQVIGRTSPELGLWNDPSERRRLVEALERDGLVRDLEYAGQTRDGATQITSLSAEIIQVGGESCNLAVATDITDRRRAEEEVRRSRQELRDLTARLQMVREEERARISREIHDELGQALTGLKIDLAWIRSRIKDHPEPLERVQSALMRIDGTMDAVRRIASELRPSVLDDLGLVAAVEWQAQEFERRTGITVALEVRVTHQAIDDIRSTTVFRMLQETLTNVARHAGASRVEVSLLMGDDMVHLNVRDDGRGITPEEIAGRHSLGLIGLRERAIACGGELVIRGVPHRGTTVSVRIPLAAVRPDGRVG
jgi:PAS domain S-box-containing protein